MLKDQEIPDLHIGIVYAVIMLDELVHTQDHPFCSDSSCPCHNDIKAFRELIELPVLHGQMTPAQGARYFYGEKVQS